MFELFIYLYISLFVKYVYIIFPYGVIVNKFYFELILSNKLFYV